MELHATRLQPETRAYPLATKQGVNLLLQAVSAREAWGKLTRTQRGALSPLYEAVRTNLDAAGDGRVSPVPTGDMHPLTRAALQRRGLVNGEHLTPAGALIVFWAGA